MRSFIIKEKYLKYENQNIYKALGNIYPNLSVGNLNKVFRLKDVKVNKSRVTKDYILRAGDNVEVYLTDEVLFGTTTSIKVVYEDQNILVALKPVHMASCNESHKYKPDELYMENVLRKQTSDNVKICHRLDTNTEGLVIFAKNEVTHKELLNAFKEHLITKRYITFVYGVPLKKQDILKAYLVKDNSAGTVKIFNTPVKHSEEIITEYLSLDYLSHVNVSILEVTLHTGRTHQIRAHLNYVGTPVIGDPKYCSHEINKKFKLKYQALVAYSYEFNFPKGSPLYYLNAQNIKLDKDDVISKIAKKM